MSPPPLTPGPSGFAMIIDPAGRFLVQHRDDLPHIWFPGLWGFFGGRAEPDEAVDAAVRREVLEEVEVALGELAYFTRFDVDFGYAGLQVIGRQYFVATVTRAQLAGATIREGQAFALLTADELQSRPMVPFDSLALYFWLNRERIVPDPG